MNRFTLIIIILFSILAGKAGAQCVSIGPAMSPICQGGISDPLGGSVAGDATSVTWSDNVGGTFSNVNDGNATWSPPAGYFGTATLTLTGSGGTLCTPAALSKQIIVYATPSAPTGSGEQSFCAINSPTVANLTATGSGIKWYTTPSSGTPLLTTVALTTANYYASQTVNGCESSARLQVAVVVSDPAAPAGSASQSFCSSLNPTVSSLVASGSSIKWYPTINSLVALAGSTALVNGATYYATQTVGSCESDTRLAVTVTLTSTNTINRTSVAGSDAQTVCAHSPITNITYATTVATGASVTGLPAGVTGSWGANVVTITGTPTVAGSFTYTVTLTGGCGTVTASGTIAVTALPVATFSYSSLQFCSSESNPSPIYSGGGVAGTFSSTTGLVFVSTATGQVNLSASTPGTYTVTNTIAAAGGCGLVSATASITITASPTATIFYTGSPWCQSATVQAVTIIGTTGGAFSTLPATGLTINAVSGSITPATSTPGTYTVIYTIPAVGGCVSYSTTTSVTISTTPAAPTIGAITQPTCSVATGSVVISGLPATGLWTLTRTPGGTTTSGSGSPILLTGIPSGTYTFTVANAAGCVSPASVNVVIDAQPTSPAAPAQTVDCSLGFGLATVTVTSPVGAGLQYSLDGNSYVSSPVFTAVANGSHYFSVRNLAGCTTTGSLFAVSCGCVNPPTVTLSSLTGSTCSTAAITVTGNTFGGSATAVTITDNGSGTVTPASATVSPFLFTYTPGATDGGKIVTITVTTNNPVGGVCSSGVATYTLTVNAMPSAPVIGTITNLSCTVSTGSVVLNGLPATGNWTLVRNPGAIITNGSGSSTTITGLVAGTYSFIVTSAEGCTSAASSNVVITPPPSAPAAPTIGTITQPTCAISTGSVALSGLPSSGNWTLTRNPGSVAISGSGSTSIVSALPSGTFTFTVTNSVGCISSPSSNVVINAQPAIPQAPTVGTITPPTCSLATGSVVLSGLPATGTWTLIRYPGTISTTGTGVSTTISGLSLGTYNFTVTTSDGCLSVPSSNVIIPVQPASPDAPVIGAITQPTFSVPTGSVVLSGLPSTGTWIITRTPGAITTSGSGTTKTITELPGGVFSFTVTNSTGCTSAKSADVTISTPGAPVLTITNPAAVCYPATVDLTKAEITAGSTAGLTFSYWLDSNAFTSYGTPSAATDGTYYIKGTTVSGYFNIKPVIVTVENPAPPNAGPDQTLYYQTSTTLAAVLAANETGIWSFGSGSGTFESDTSPVTTVSDLSQGENMILWTVKSGVCPAVADTVNITVEKLFIPTLITPNMDGRNDYLVIKGLENLGKTELYIFDRRGAEVYKNLNYDNSWDGVDYNKKALPDDTYFYVLKSENGQSLSGYIVIRR